MRVTMFYFVSYRRIISAAKLTSSLIGRYYRPLNTMPSDTFQWKDRGTAWRGVGIYHVTLTIPGREPLLGELVIPDNDPAKAEVKRTQLGEDLIDCLMHLYEHYPEVRILQFCLMPDHLHVIWHVRQTMPRGIMSVARGFWQAAKTLGRNYTSSLAPNTIRDKKQSQVLFSEMPFVRPLVHQGQLHSMIRYVQLNPQRLATKKLHPGFFYVQENVEIAGRMYSAVGNIALLQAEKYSPVHVRRTMVDYAEHGETQPLRDYKNSCVLAARQGTVMVSPFISEHEKTVLDVLLKEKQPIIYLADNGFDQYFKPSDALFDAVAEGRLLILSPWPYDPKKKSVTRAECVALNAMAEEICSHS